jgi:hypothetical protein
MGLTVEEFLLSPLPPIATWEYPTMGVALLSFGILIGVLIRRINR